MLDDMSPMQISEMKTIAGDTVRSMGKTLEDARKLVEASPSPTTINTASRVGATLANAIGVVMDHNLVVREPE